MTDQNATVLYGSGRYVRYTPGVETIEDDEQESFQAIIEAMSREGKTTQER